VKQPVAPFLLPPADAVSHGGWHLSGPEGDALLPDEMDHWDYQTTLNLNAAVSVDRALVTSSCELSDSSELGLVVTAHSTHTGVEERMAKVAIPEQDRYDLAVHVELPGENLGGRLTLRTTLVVLAPSPLGPLSPVLPGSILWTTEHRSYLQGTGAQFPTDASDFAQARLGSPNAGWDLYIDLTDPDALFMSAVRLTLNSGHPAIKRLLDGATDESTQQLERTLRWDVVRQMVMLGLETPEVLERDVSLDAESVAGILRNTLAQVWPQDDAEAVRGWFINDRARIERDLQHHCGLLP